MKQMNNKAFAASALIYGLSILSMMVIVIIMNIVSTTRKNTKDIVKTIEEDLNRLSKTETIFSERTTDQEYIVLENGWYKIELCGKNPKKYASGLIRLYENDILKFLVTESEIKVKATISDSGENQDSDIMLIGKDADNKNIIYISGYLDNQREAGHYFVDGLVLNSKGSTVQAKIKKIGNISDDNMRKNVKMNNIIGIKDCISKNNNPVWTKIVAMYQGSDVSSMYEEETTEEVIGGINMECKKMMFNNSNGYNIDELTVWHEAKEYENHIIKAIDKNSNEKSLISSGKYNETASGVRVSAYQQSTNEPLGNGIYYIISTAKDNKVIGLKTTNEVTVQGVTESLLQKWKIIIDGEKYQIMNMKDNKFLKCNGANITAVENDPSSFTITGNVDNTYEIKCGNNTVYLNSDDKLSAIQNPSNGYKFRLIYMY